MTTLNAISLLGDMLEEKEADLSILENEAKLEALNELWELYQSLLD